MKAFFTVGDLAQLFAINVQTLRYYDSIGLLTPSNRDRKTGYRLYRFDQIYHLASILYLKRLGYSLKQIREYLDSRTLTHTMQQLKSQSVLLRQRWQELIDIDSAIQRKLEFINSQLPGINLQETSVKSFPDRYYIHIGTEETLYMSDVFYFHPTLVFYEEGGKRFGAYLFEYDPSGAGEPPLEEVSVIPSGSFLCGYHQGSYETIHTSIERIRREAEDRNLAPWELNFNILDQFVERDSSRFITEIQIPLLNS